MHRPAEYSLFVGTALVAALLSPAAATAVEFDISPEVAGFSASSLTKLPEGPHPVRQDDNCSTDIIVPTTAAGRYVEQRGWGVISETRLGRYQLVSFGGIFIPGTSGSCAIEQSNIGLFESDRLKAIVYTGAKTDRFIGQLHPMEDGSVRLWGGDFLQSAVADLVVRAGKMVLRPLAAEDTACNGTAFVPNIFDLPITKAREKLQSRGWKPVPQALTADLSQQDDLQAIGVVEVEACSGTGFGFCSYVYQGAVATLLVTTAGELYQDQVPAVAWYDVTCNKP